MFSALGTSVVTTSSLHTFYKAHSWGTAIQRNKKSWNPYLPGKAVRLEPNTKVLWASPWFSSSGAQPPESHPMIDSVSSATLPLLSPPLPPARENLITICFSCPSKVTEKMSSQDPWTMKTHLAPLLSCWLSICLPRALCASGEIRRPGFKSWLGHWYPVRKYIYLLCAFMLSSVKCERRLGIWEICEKMRKTRENTGHSRYSLHVRKHLLLSQEDCSSLGFTSRPTGAFCSFSGRTFSSLTPRGQADGGKLHKSQLLTDGLCLAGSEIGLSNGAAGQVLGRLSLPWSIRAVPPLRLRILQEIQ